MHYKIKGKTYKSENAARSHIQRQKDLVAILKQFGKFENVLDYGCGKLRYFKDLSEISKNLYLHDSPQQLSRMQLIQGETTTIIDFINKYKRLSILLEDEIPNYQQYFDFILLSNVLSAIPSNIQRIAVLKNIELLLKNNATALIVLQYKNSYFEDYEIRKGVKAHNGGYLFESNGQVRYYGLIDERKLRGLILKTNLNMISVKKRNGRLFVVVQKNKGL